MEVADEVEVVSVSIEMSVLLVDVVNQVRECRYVVKIGVEEVFQCEKMSSMCYES